MRTELRDRARSARKAGRGGVSRGDDVTPSPTGWRFSQGPTGGPTDSAATGNPAAEAPVTLVPVRGSAALRRVESVETAALRAVVFDVCGRQVVLDLDQARLLRDAAAARAGRSSVARDLSSLLDRGLTREQVIALRRGEARALERLADELGLQVVAHQATARSGLAASHPAYRH